MEMMPRKCGGEWVSSARNRGCISQAPGNCVNCHAPDPDGEALVDGDGHTVSPVVDWQATMMANSAKDPFWRAKVAHEGLVNPNHRESIENLCTACHAPQGFHEAHLTGQSWPQWVHHGPVA